MSGVEIAIPAADRVPTQILWPAGTLTCMTVDDKSRLRARDAAIRRSRMIIAGVAASAVALSGLFAGVAAHAFKAHQQGTAAATPASDAGAPAQPTAGDGPGPLQPPSEPPSASRPQASAPQPEPQVSGGS